MKNKIAGSLLKFSAIIILAITIRFEMNPLVYLMLGMVFCMGWKMQYLPDVMVRVPQKRRSSVVAKRHIEIY